MPIASSYLSRLVQQHAQLEQRVFPFGARRLERAAGDVVAQQLLGPLGVALVPIGFRTIDAGLEGGAVERMKLDAFLERRDALRNLAQRQVRLAQSQQRFGVAQLGLVLADTCSAVSIVREKLWPRKKSSALRHRSAV